MRQNGSSLAGRCTANAWLSTQKKSNPGIQPLILTKSQSTTTTSDPPASAHLDDHVVQVPGGLGGLAVALQPDGAQRAQRAALHTELVHLWQRRAWFVCGAKD